jgi:hypothetical protein
MQLRRFVICYAPYEFFPIRPSVFSALIAAETLSSEAGRNGARNGLRILVIGMSVVLRGNFMGDEIP